VSSTEGTATTLAEQQAELAAKERAWMRRALTLAQQGWGQTAPNPMVGAVVVRDGLVVGEGFHPRFGAPHAEVMALAEAGTRARGATVFVSLEPCNHHGKTPPCVDALMAAGVARVVIAMHDPNPVAAGGAERLRAAGIAVEFGLLERAALDLNAPFIFAAKGAERPWVTLKLALDADGAMAPADRSQQWLTGEEARRRVHELRAGHDAMAVGIGTALADDPRLDVRGVTPPRVLPRRVVFDRRARLPVGGRLASTATVIPVTLLAADPDPARREALARLGVECLVEERLSGQLEMLRARYDLRSLLVEGGPTLADALWEANLVDRLVIFQAPVRLGPDALRPFGGERPYEASRIVAQQRLGPDLLTEYAIHDP
jgi:diaminohydroxyphosphoribosylaminopyrimidine deaminase/5-amino-6-(5-phosphoribosylamino)uracil reductase